MSSEDVWLWLSLAWWCIWGYYWVVLIMNRSNLPFSLMICLSQFCTLLRKNTCGCEWNGGTLSQGKYVPASLFWRSYIFYTFRLKEKSGVNQLTVLLFNNAVSRFDNKGFWCNVDWVCETAAKLWWSTLMGAQGTLFHFLFPAVWSTFYQVLLLSYLTTELGNVRDDSHISF